MSGLVDSDFLAGIDEIRGIPDDLGVAPYTFALRTITWSGARVGLGTKTITDKPIKVDGGQHNPTAKLVSSKDAIASGGLYTSTDLKVGPLTPSYGAGGVSAADVDPPQGSVPTEVYFVVTGPGIPSGGVLYKRVGGEMASSTQYFVVLRSTGRAATPA